MTVAAHRFWAFARGLTRALGALALGLALALLAAPAATAQPVAGHDDPAFREALTDWLADEEGRALHALAELAQDGNAAARLLLGLIDKTPALQGAYLEHLDRGTRIALMRAPGGLSGVSWLTLIDANPLTDALRAVWSVDSGLETVATLEALGETRASREALTILAAREDPGLAALPPESMDSELLYLLWRGADPERRQRILARVPPGHPQRRHMGQPVDARDIDLWLASAEAAAPIARLCNAVCPGDEAAACRGIAYEALNSHDALLTLGTPAEALVAQAPFLDSPRGRGAVMRRILLSTSMRGRRALLNRIAARSQCLGEALSAENARYLPRVTGRP
ncbi:MAG: hypothetical protein Kow0013_09830 [Pararhodobacter sp.]